MVTNPQNSKGHKHPKPEFTTVKELLADDGSIAVRITARKGRHVQYSFELVRPKVKQEKPGQLDSSRFFQVHTQKALDVVYLVNPMNTQSVVDVIRRAELWILEESQRAEDIEFQRKVDKGEIP